MTTLKLFLNVKSEAEEIFDWIYHRTLGKVNMAAGVIGVSYDRIKDLLVNPDGAYKPDKIEHCKPFLPRDAIQTLIQGVCVKSTLREKGIKKLIDFYGTGDAGIVFLTLVQIEAKHDIWKILRKENFTDARFPVGKVANRNGLVRSINKDGTVKAPQTGFLTKSSAWSGRAWDDFLESQWLFVAPVFHERQFSYKFVYECRLPFVDIKDGKIYRGHFGTVFQLGLRPDHAEFANSSALRISEKGYIEVGLKVMEIEKTETTDTDVEKFYNKEKGTLEKMRDLNHPHLVKAFAAYERAHFRCFIFPWARGGNLHNFWNHDSSKLEKDLIMWAIKQMAGISGGIAKLHEARIRHGDIKPLNILYYPKFRNNSAWGDLVVADVGLAKVHETYTKDREPGTTTKHGTNMYEPPEMISFSRTITTISQKYDTWSLGCVFLEFIIWLLYGPRGLKSFYDDLEATATWRFWVQSGDSWKLHDDVASWIRTIRGQIYEASALGRLIGFISRALLVPVEGRATAEALTSEMEAIHTECPVKRLSHVGPGMEILAKQRSGNMPTSQADQELMSPSNEVGRAR